MIRRFSILSFVTVFFMLFSCKSTTEEAEALRLKHDFDAAFVLYQEAADNGDAYAKWRLANAYANGDGVDFDNEKALELLKEASKSGCEEAICDMACAYMHGWYGQKIDSKKGKDMMKTLVSKTKNSYVKSRYARELFYGWTFEEDCDKAYKILESVEDKNNALYLRAMGELYYNGSDKIKVDYKKAIKYFTKAFENGNTYSAGLVGTIYVKGNKDSKESNNIPQDIKKAVEWFNKGVEANNSDCMLAMYMVCMSVDSVFAEYHNKNRGIEQLRKAVSHGNAKAMNILGSLYQDGEFIEKNDEKAFEYYKKAFSLQNPDGAFNLGLAYMNGIGCEKSIDDAIKVWKKAVEFGHGGAANNLCGYYASGEYANDQSVINKDLARKYLKEGARLGEPMACWNIGMQYLKGDYLFEKNEVQAFTYIKMAADKGVVDACKVLAYMYNNAIGCNKDINAAKKYQDMAKPKEDKK